jgi:hypothetical protein
VEYRATGVADRIPMARELVDLCDLIFAVDPEVAVRAARRAAQSR